PLLGVLPGQRVGPAVHAGPEAGDEGVGDDEGPGGVGRVSPGRPAQATRPRQELRGLRPSGPRWTARQTPATPGTEPTTGAPFTGGRSGGRGPQAAGRGRACVPRPARAGDATPAGTPGPAAVGSQVDGATDAGHARHGAHD